MLKLNNKSNLDNKHRLGGSFSFIQSDILCLLGCLHLITFNVTLDRVGFKSIIWYLLSNCSNSCLFPPFLTFLFFLLLNSFL